MNPDSNMAGQAGGVQNGAPAMNVQNNGTATQPAPAADKNKKTKIISVVVMIVAAIVAGVIAFLAVTSGNNKNSNNGTNNSQNSGSSKEEAKKESKGNCDVFECMDKLSLDDTLEEMNEIIGFEGTTTSAADAKNPRYTWKLDDNSEIEASFSNELGKTMSISASFSYKDVKNYADLSSWNWDEIKSRVNSSEGMTYDDFVKALNGVEGVVSRKDSTSTQYRWYDKDGGYLMADFGNSTKKCTTVSGRF